MAWDDISILPVLGKPCKSGWTLGAAEIFLLPSYRVLQAVALPFCTVAAKCVFQGVSTQWQMGRGHAQVLLGSLSLSLL